MNARNVHLIALVNIQTVIAWMMATLMVNFVGIVHMAQTDYFQIVNVMKMLLLLWKQTYA